MVRYLINTARPLIFSTAPSPPSVAGALAALELLERQPHEVEHLHHAARALRGALAGEGFVVADNNMHIVPLVVGDSENAMRLCQATLERGVFAQAIRPPTVAEGTSRLRLATMASHSVEELRQAATALAGAAREVGLDPTRLGEPAALARQSATPASREASTPNAAPPSTPNTRATSTPNAAPPSTPNAGPTSTPNASPTSTPNAAPPSTPSAGPASKPRLAHVA
jgi:glycine C-acetyltransferase/8-amino-7-oxononanoate synthase